MLKASCSQVLSSFWEWDTRIAPSLLAHGNDDQSAKVSPTHDGFSETMIRIWLRKRHLINKLSLMYQPPTPTSFGMVLQRAWKSRTFSQFWVWENNYSLFKKKKKIDLVPTIPDWSKVTWTEEENFQRQRSQCVPGWIGKLTEIQDHRFMVGFLTSDIWYWQEIPNGFKDKLLHITFLWPSLDPD